MQNIWQPLATRFISDKHYFNLVCLIKKLVSQKEIMSCSIFKKQKLDSEGSGRDFQEWWSARYGVIDVKGKAL